MTRPRHFSALLDGTNYAIIAVDKNGIITEFNRAASSLLEYEPEEVIGKFTPEIFHDEEEMEQYTKEINQRYNAGIKKGIITLTYKNKIGIPDSNEWTYITKSGKRLNASVTFTTLKNESGKVIGNMSVAQDITAKRLYEREQHMAATIIANSPSVLFRWAFDAGFTLLYVSANVDRLLGYSSLDFTSLNVRYGNLIPEEDLTPLFDQLNKTVKSRNNTISSEHRLKHKDGSVIWVEEKTFIKRDLNNKVEYIESVVTDITKNKQAEQDFKASELKRETYEELLKQGDERYRLLAESARQYTQNLERTIKEIDELSYMISHELKSPLHGLSYLTEWIREEQKPHLTTESKDNLKLLRNRIAKMEEFITRLLQYVNAGRSASKKERIDIHAFIEYLVQVKQKGAHIDVEIDAIDMEVETETKLLEQVLMSLLDNAAKFNNSPNPRIRVSCRKQDDILVFSISDNGPGIEKQYHEKIFRAFQVIELYDGARKSGVGLAIVKKILESRGGQITLESEPGKGAKFSFTWNIA